MDEFPISFLITAVIFLGTRLFTVLVHELGHAIPAILLTRQRVSIYIGSYGDPEKSLNFTVGLLEVWLKYSPLSWRLGVCVPDAKEISINRQIIYTLTGPLASGVVAAAVCYSYFAYDLYRFKFMFVIFLCFLISLIYDLFLNLIPRETPIKLYDGRFTHNDGYLLKQLFHYKRFPKEYERAAELYKQHRFAEAAEAFHEMLKRGIKDENIYRVAISSFMQAKDFKQAKAISDEFLMQGNANSNDFVNAGLFHSYLKEHDQAMEMYDKSLALDPDNKYALNNKGFTFNDLNKFEEAIPIFNKALEIDPAFAHSYSNRGLAKIKTGKTEEGLDDINHSLKLDENNSYGYRNLGIYHLDKGEYSKALDLFRKAKELDSNTHMIDELIHQSDKQ
jgi:tetratricopeptide (TPR) repeat protein